ELAGVWQWLADLPGRRARAVRPDVLAGLIEGLSRSPSRKRVSTAGQRALARLLTKAGPEQKQVLQVAGLVGVVDLPAFRAARWLLVKTARDENRPARACRRPGLAGRRPSGGVDRAAGPARGAPPARRATGRGGAAGCRRRCRHRAKALQA